MSKLVTIEYLNSRYTTLLFFLFVGYFELMQLAKSRLEQLIYLVFQGRQSLNGQQDM